MPLPTGARIGPYEVMGVLGAGGMGEVYRAHDPRLSRDVALKVLPEVFAADPERLARFQREAQVLAALKHPNIGVIYGLEEGASEAGVQLRALVLELVEGDTLADRIAAAGAGRPEGRPLQTTGRGLPLDEALPIAKQIAEALEAAHEQGVVHRDLKPSNIKITPDGLVKVLDFGLAKLTEASGAGRAGGAGGVAGAGGLAGLSLSPTVTSPAATGLGVILGTAAYMAPEQAKGRPADKRSDVWAFGCVLYEMLAGKRAFDGDDVSDTLATVLKGEPDWTALPANLPPAVRTVLRRCLEKDRRKRVGDIAAALFVIDEAPSLVTAAAPESPAEAGHHVRRGDLPLRRRAVPYVMAVILTAAVTGYTAWSLKPAPTRAVTRFSVVLAEGDQFTNTARHVVAMSPDGTRFVYVANNRLNLRLLDQLESTPIRGSETGNSPFFSPDGQWIGFWQGGQLKKVSVTGGAPVTLCAAQTPFGVSWGTEETIVYGQGAQGIWRVSGAGGAPEQIVKVESGESAHGPQLLSDGQAVLFTLRKGGGSWDDAQVVVQSLGDGTRQMLIAGGKDARYVSTGHLVYAFRGTLFAVPFEVNTLRVSGGPVSLVEDVADAVVTTGATHFGVSRDGTLAYVPGFAGSAKRALVWVDRQGREEPLAAPPRSYVYPRLSPDGTKVALDVREESNDIWIWDLARQTLTRLTFDPELNRGVVWSPDGRRVAFSAVRDGSENVYWQPADGTGVLEALTREQRGAFPNSFSPDGKRLVFSQPPGTPPRDLGVVALDGDRKAELIVKSTFNEANGEISPDGRWLAYQSNESGRDEIYVRPFPDVTSGRWQVSNGGGTRPLWARNGRELFYYLVPGTVITVPIESGATFVAGTPNKVLAGAYVAPLEGRTYDVSLDGRRFLMLKTAETTNQTATTPRIIVVQNWFEELKRRVPTN